MAVDITNGIGIDPCRCEPPSIPYGLRGGKAHNFPELLELMGGNAIGRPALGLRQEFRPRNINRIVQIGMPTHSLCSSSPTDHSRWPVTHWLCFSVPLIMRSTGPNATISGLTRVLTTAGRHHTRAASVQLPGDVVRPQPPREHLRGPRHLHGPRP